MRLLTVFIDLIVNFTIKKVFYSVFVYRKTARVDWQWDNYLLLLLPLPLPLHEC